MFGEYLDFFTNLSVSGGQNMKKYGSSVGSGKQALKVSWFVSRKFLKD